MAPPRLALHADAVGNVGVIAIDEVLLHRPVKRPAEHLLRRNAAGGGEGTGLIDRNISVTRPGVSLVR